MASGSQLWDALGTNAISAPTAISTEYNLAVAGDIRTTSERDAQSGSQYTLGMTPTGTTYAGTWGGLFDGTTDGVHNFSLDWDTGNVLSFDRSWANPSTLFTLAGGQGGYLGITSDGSGGLWVSQWNGSAVEHRTMGGTLLGGFTANFIDITCLAMDYNTGTLWMGTQGQEGTFWQYSTSGQLLQVVSYSNMAGVNTLGGEFNRGTVPEPVSLAVLGLGALALLRRKRAKN
jgi:hypothetical protein